MVSLKVDLGIKLSTLSDFCRLFQSLAAADWNDDRPSAFIVLGTLKRKRKLGISAEQWERDAYMPAR